MFQVPPDTVAVGVTAPLGEAYLYVPPIARTGSPPSTTAKSAIMGAGAGGRALFMQPAEVLEAPPPPPLPPPLLPPLFPPPPCVPALPVVPADPVEPAVPVPLLPPLLSLPQPTVETLDTRKPTPARPRIPKNALILNSFMVLFSVRIRSCPPSPRRDWAGTLMPIWTVD